MPWNKHQKCLWKFRKEKFPPHRWPKKTWGRCHLREGWWTFHRVMLARLRVLWGRENDRNKGIENWGPFIPWLTISYQTVCSALLCVQNRRCLLPWSSSQPWRPGTGHKGRWKRKAQGAMRTRKRAESMSQGSLAWGRQTGAGICRRSQWTPRGRG